MTPSACGGKIWGQCCSTPSYLSLAPDFYWLIHPALETSGHRRSPWSSFSKGWFAGGKSWPWSAMFLLRACLNSSVSTITYRRGGVAIYPSEIILSLPPAPTSSKSLLCFLKNSPKIYSREPTFMGCAMPMVYRTHLCSCGKSVGLWIQASL